MNSTSLEIDNIMQITSLSAEAMVLAMKKIIADNVVELDKLLTNRQPSFHSLVVPLEFMHLKLHTAFNQISNLHAVMNDKEIQAVYEAILPLISEYETNIGQNNALFSAFQEIHQSTTFAKLSIPEQTLIKDALRDFKQAGVHLPPQEKITVKALHLKISELGNVFDQNILDTKTSWIFVVEEEKMLEGLPQYVLDLAAQLGKEKKVKEKALDLSYPIYHAVMTYAQNRTLRETFYKAYVTRASSTGTHLKEFDNAVVMEEIIAARLQLAQILGCQNYAEYSLTTKMANTPTEVLLFLEKLMPYAKRYGHKELQELQDFMKKQGVDFDIAPWDVAFYSEKLSQETYQINQETLRSYFPLHKVMQGLFEIIKRLFGIRIEEKIEVTAWHDDVKVLTLYNNDNSMLGEIYLDLFSRKNKMDGAWANPVRDKLQTPEYNILPIAYIITNFTPIQANTPCLLTHDEVVTLFHEFGHAIHHVVTIVPYPSVGAGAVPWDAIELPSQFLENWCWEEEALQLISEHQDTKAPLPADLLHNLKASKNFQAGLQLARQLEFCLFDLLLHTKTADINSAGIQQLANEVREKTAIIQPPAYNRYQNSFSHIFAGGYAAGYYSYKWAEVLSADAFDKFKENGIFDANTGKLFFETILTQGGSQPAMDLFVQFRSRKPEVVALLAQSGMQ